MAHEHNHSSHQLSGKKIGLAVLLNILITVGQMVGGVISGSVALLTDALHNFSDVISLLLSYFTNRLAKRKSTVRQTYGYKRAEIISAFVNSVTLIAIAIYLIVEAVERFFAPREVLSDLVIYFALGSIIINFLSVLLLHKDSKDSMNIKSAYLHLLTDVMTSVAVLIGGLLMKYFEFYWVDSLLSVAIAFYLIFASYKLLVESLKILMQFTPTSIDAEKISSEIETLEEVKNVHHIHFWQLNDKDIFFEAHLDLEKDIKITDFQKIISAVDKILHSHGISHFNIQPEFDRADKKSLVIQH